MEEKDFLMPSVENIRKSIKDIDDSYSHFWDILAELLQNATDAIKIFNEETNTHSKGTIGITIDCLKKSISIYDSGKGFSPQKIDELLTPFGTDKEKIFYANGEKGVGIDYAIFQSNTFRLKTKYYSDSKVSIIEINNAKNWKNGKEKELLKLKQDYIDNKDEFKGTEIRIDDIENDTLFQLSFEELKFIIRTKTAIGNVLALFEKIDDIDVWLKVIDLNGNYKEEKIPYKYWLPIENVEKRKIQDVKDFKEWLKEGDYNDKEKIKKISNKIIVKKDVINHKGREIKYWACMLQDREKWDELSIKDHLLNEKELENMSNTEKANYLDDKKFTMHTSGIFSSSKGMPTGILTPHSSHIGNVAYVPLFFIVFEDASLKLDIGRKALPGAIAKIYANYAKEIFNEFAAIKNNYRDKDTKDYETVIDTQQIMDDLKILPDLNKDYNKIINLEKTPYNQEASVIAIFYQLLGRDISLNDNQKLFKNFKVLTTKYKDRYDLLATVNNKFVFVEFKSKLSKIISDIDNQKKFLDELNYIVCWNIDDNDMKDLKSSYNLNVVECYDKYKENENPIQAVTHRIITPASHPVYVIDLKVLLEKICEEK